MRICVYEPSLREVMLPDGESFVVPSEVVDSVEPEAAPTVVRRWAQRAGLLAHGDQVGMFQAA